MTTEILGARLPCIIEPQAGISPPRDDKLPNDGSHLDSRDAIRRRAYALWEIEGHPADRDLVNWRDAETELRALLRVGTEAIPPAPLESWPRRNRRDRPSEPMAGELAPTPAPRDGPSPLCRAAIGDDVRDYAFHLYVHSGCAPDQEAESWREARRCLDARVPSSDSRGGKRTPASVPQPPLAGGEIVEFSS